MQSKLNIGRNIQDLWEALASNSRLSGPIAYQFRRNSSLIAVQRYQDITKSLFKDLNRTKISFLPMQ